MFSRPPRLSRPGLFITGTDTGVGKTVVACAIAAALARGGARVGVCKPFATGCRRDREGLVSEDAEALAHWSDCRQPLEVINPVRHAPPVAPAVAAAMAREPVDLDAVARSLELLDAASDVVLVEGVGGAMVPIDPAHPRTTVLDLAAAIGYPVAVVCRAGLGTLNHTALTVRALRSADCRVAGSVINGYEPDASRSADPSMSTNRSWLEKMNRLTVLATVPACPAAEVAPHRGLLPAAVLEAVALCYWPEVLASPA